MKAIRAFNYCPKCFRFANRRYIRIGGLRMNKEKKCSLCGEMDQSKFYNRHVKCKACTKAYVLAYKRGNPEKRKRHDEVANALKEVKKKAERSNGRFVYAMCMQELDGYVKIGSSEQLETRRLLELQTGNPFKLCVLTKCPGGEMLEHAIHARLESSRYRGEWFQLTPEVEKVLEEMKLDGSNLDM